MEILLIAAVVGLALLGTSWHFSRGRALLDRWAAREGFVLESADYCWFWRGPFWWRSGEGNAVYRVVVRDRDGIVRRGHARCGGLFFGMWSDEVAVVWDD